MRIRFRRGGLRLGLLGLLVGGVMLILFVGSSAAVTPPSCVTASGTTTCTYSYTGAKQSFTVPAGVTSATLSAYGAKGGTDGDFHPGGLGARATATIAVSPGSMIEVDVGGRGADGTLTAVSGAGGFNGGGAGGASVGDVSTDNAPSPGGGGGASDVRTGTCAATSSCGLDARVLVGGGGGGAGASGTIDTQGGGGGYPAGGDGHDVDPTTPFFSRTAGGGTGGTQSTGGTGGAGESGCGETAGGNGAAGIGGKGGNAQTDATRADGGGGGGGGYYGGGGGGGGCQGDEGGGGGGGSSFGPNDATFDNAVGSGDGQVTISYEEPATPDLTIMKTHTGDFTQGRTGDYTITVANSGTGPTSGTVTVTDALPSGLATTLIVSSNAWDCTGSTSTVMTCTRTAALPAADSSAITLTVKVASDAQSVTNTASVSGGGETNTANDTASDPTTVVSPTRVTNVTSNTADGAYRFGANVSVKVEFSEPVVVTGTPQLALNSGATVNYSFGSGTSTLIFIYTVAAGQNSADLDYTSASSLTLNGGTITDGASTAADLTLPAPGTAGSLGANQDIVIDTIPPVVTCGATPTFLLGSTGNRVSATVTDPGGSGPLGSPVQAAAPATSAGPQSVLLGGADNALNTTARSCPYVVGYKFGGFTSPLPKSTVKSGSTLPIKFQLQDAAGHPISDTEARSLVSPTCKVAIILVKPAAAVPGCPTYSATFKQFQFNLKTTNAMKGTNGVSITVTIGGTIVTASAPPDPFTVK